MFLKNRIFLSALSACAGFVLAGKAAAQTFTTLHNFAPGEGVQPHSAPILLGNRLYATTACCPGTVFTLGADGTGFATVHRFVGGDFGDASWAGLVCSSNTLYGTTGQGGISNNGTVFRVGTGGEDFTILHHFTGGSGGGFPEASLILSSNTLYGTTLDTVFKVDIDGTHFTSLHIFTPTAASSPFTNSDGAESRAGLVLSSNTLFGTTRSGGIAGNGTIFAVHTDGTDFRVLHTFTAVSAPPYFTNNDGVGPRAGLVLAGDILYGTATGGGSSGSGTVFALRTDGTDFTTLHAFSRPRYTNIDGCGPIGGLVISGTFLYGTASGGGSFGNGTVFQVRTDGTDFRTLHSFSGHGGTGPYAGLALSSGTLYGTTFGGEGFYGTVFSLTLPSAPKLTISYCETNAVLTWPTNADGFILQSTTNVASPSVWAAVSPPPVVANTQNTVTNAMSGSHRYYRLSQQAE